MGMICPKRARAVWNRRFLVPLALAALAAAASAQDPVDKTLELESGATLEYIERVPFSEYLEPPYPIFVCLPPGAGDRRMAQAARLHIGDLAWKAGYVTILPISRTGGFRGEAAEEVLELIEHVRKEHGSGKELVLAGLSNGGRGVFEVASRAPGQFDALVAAPGVAAPELDLSGLEGVPVWLRVGSLDDPKAWIEPTAQTAERLEAAGARVDHAVIEGQGHVLDLSSQKIFDWLSSVLASGPRQLQFSAPDGLSIEADFYGSDADRSAPIVVLCHQAGSSRGEYAPIAPRLVEAGFACLAIDQRSGREMNGVANETAARVENPPSDRAENMLSAKGDIEAALAWVREAGFSGPLILWGSSYSASLALVVAAGREDIAGVLSFSPGEYFRGKLKVADYAGRVDCPILFVSPESERAQVEGLRKAAGADDEHVVGGGIQHGSRTLFQGTESERVWGRVLAFLGRVAKRRG